VRNQETILLQARPKNKGGKETKGGDPGILIRKGVCSPEFKHTVDLQVRTISTGNSEGINKGLKADRKKLSLPGRYQDHTFEHPAEDS